MKLSPSEFSQLTLQHPRLWWPNGYGKPELYTLNLTFLAGELHESDAKDLRFGIREITYELSLFDTPATCAASNILRPRRVAEIRSVVDVTSRRHARNPCGRSLPSILPAGMERRTGSRGWHPSAPARNTPHAVKMHRRHQESTYLVIKVNGVRIACRGGNWGMDDSRKRVSREHSSPTSASPRCQPEHHPQLGRAEYGANLLTISPTNTDCMVWNDFWASTQDYNVEPQDPTCS